MKWSRKKEEIIYEVLGFIFGFFDRSIAYTVKKPKCLDKRARKKLREQKNEHGRIKRERQNNK
jgi:hypothetical protein